MVGTLSNPGKSDNSVFSQVTNFWFTMKVEIKEPKCYHIQC